ncbi:BspA family leucine-rich repeat surface protein [Butyrivibrio hungatei]|uniref:Cell surface protein n=1 Tax=Butyrivibrio hungatei TaxID=185008 RepID=A0A1D9P5F4_9FIRM|nr:BspA family leucine-rich repeat surface protein [Butyrivibrio hungatei]AOZ97818.1 cell surface protein [Butyrivibrio hungatei]
MKRLRYLLAIASTAALFATTRSPLPVYAADTISYQYLDGTSLTATDTTSDADFTNAKAEVADAGKTVISFLYETCRTAPNPSVLDGGGVVTVVTEDMVEAHGNSVGGNSNAKWFIYDGKLYITGTTGKIGEKVTISDNGTATGSNTVKTEFTGTSFDVEWPSLMYDFTTIGGGKVNDSVVGDEKDFLSEKFYTTTEPTKNYMSLEIANREDISIASKVDGHIGGDMEPSKVGWHGKEGSITEIYISDDIELSGNMNGLFNSNFTYIRETGKAGDMGDSLYTSLKNVYLYCDMSKVTSAAGMFARIGTLENIYVRNGDVKPLTNMVSTAYMFYGDKNLVNGTDSFIDAMDLSGATNLYSTAFMYGGCESISQPNVSSYHMDGVQCASGMFFGAKNANLVSEPNGAGTNNIYSWNLGSVVEASAMFSAGDADGVIDLDKPLGNMDPGLLDITEYGDVITGTVDMSNWGMDNVKMMGYMFSHNGENFRGIKFGASYPELIDASCLALRCDYISNIEMGSSMPTLKNATAMFRGAGSKAAISSADISGWSAPVLEHVDVMFASSGFSTIDTSGISALDNVVSAAGMFKDCKNLSSLGNDAMGTVKFGSLEDARFMFDGDTALTKVDTSSWDMSKTKDISFMFSDCSSLISGVEVKNWGVSSVLTNAESFARNTKISMFDLSNWDTRYVKNFAFAFADNEKLGLVNMMSDAKSLFNAETIMGMFANDTGLAKVSAFAQGNKLKDARGVFANDTALASAGVTNLVQSNCKNASYFFKNCSSLTNADLSGWDTVNLVYAQGLFDGCSALNSVSVGKKFTAANLQDVGTMFRNNYKLPSSQLKKVLSNFGSSSNLECAYEMMKNCYTLTELDLSAMNLSNTVELRRIAAMEVNADYPSVKLTTIKLPESILTATGVVLKDTDGSSINMFWVEGAEDSAADDVLTTLFIDGTPGANILAYAFGGANGDNDNRSFVEIKSKTINGNAAGTYSLKDDSDKAVMLVDAVSKLYTGGITEASATIAPLAYSWAKDDSNIAGATTKTYTTQKSGSYVVSVFPEILTGAKGAKTASFVIGAEVVGIVAEYNGEPVTVGEKYSKGDVVVSIIDAGGKKVPLTADDWSADSYDVTKKGDNTFTVTYKDGNNSMTAKLTVPGIRNIGLIEATYSGPAVLVGNEYDSSYVKVMAYYTDDANKKEGFEVEPTKFSTKKVTEAGDNSINAYYVDKAQNEKEFSAPFIVNGYKTVKSIAANYTGGQILVGNKYNVDDVTVTLYYADGTNGTTKNFEVNSQTVTAEGGNSFTSTYRDPYGNTYTAGFSVPGYVDASTTAATTDAASSVSTASTVVAPIPNASASTVRRGTSSGNVQTGRTGKIVFYMIAIACLVIFIVVASKAKGDLKSNGKRGKRNR